MFRISDFERAADRGTGPLLFKFFLLLLTISIVTGATGWLLGWFSETGEVAKEEFGPKAALEKYEWFVDQAARIEQMDAQVSLFAQKAADVDSQYAMYERPASWDPITRAQYNQAKEATSTDLLAMKSQRNTIVRDYNAASEKFNWSPFQTRPDKPKKRYFELTSE